jgi:hypothetical protein
MLAAPCLRSYLGYGFLAVVGAITLAFFAAHGSL